ncbi:hypothetical protein DVH24_041715, partial [Malus domestica]
KQKQEEVIDHFVKQASSLNGSALGPLVTEVIYHPTLFSFSEIIDVPNVLQELKIMSTSMCFDCLHMAHGVITRVSMQKSLRLLVEFLIDELINNINMLKAF